jgi:lysozyme
MALPRGATARDYWLDLADEARAKRDAALVVDNHHIARLWDAHERDLLRHAYEDVPFPGDSAERSVPDTAPADGIHIASADDEFLMAADGPRVTNPITVIDNPNEVDPPPRQIPSALSSTGAASAIIQKAEKSELKKYQDPGGHWTVGTGHKLTDAEAARYPQVIDAATADRLLAEDIEKAEAIVRRLVKVPLSQNEFDAMVSYTFNIGEGNLAKSKLLEKLNAGDYEGVAKLFPQSFVTSSGKRLRGLERRRIEEQKLFQQR